MSSHDVTHGELEIEIPWDEVQKESEKVLRAYQRQARIPGFRPGKAPPAVIRMRYGDEVKREVLESLVPKHFWREAEEQDYEVVGQPQIRDVHFHDNEPLKFRAEFEMIPDFELQSYRRLQVPFREPEVNDEEVDQELERLRERHASFRNLDPRPLEDGDTAVMSLKSGEVEGAPTIDQSETTLTIGAEDTLEDFSNALRGKSPGDEVDFEVNYPEDFGNEQLASKSVPFHAEIKAIRVKELPDLDDDFAADVGDFRTLDELKARIREELGTHKRAEATNAAKEKLLDALIAKHEFAVPNRLVEDQITARLERSVRALAAQGVDPSKLDIDWSRLRGEQRERAERDVKAGLLLDRIAEAEALEAEQALIDAEVQRFAQRNQMTLASARKKLAEEGALDRLERQIVSDRALQFLFDEAEKVDPPAEEEGQQEEAPEPPATLNEGPEPSVPKSSGIEE